MGGVWCSSAHLLVGVFWGTVKVRVRRLAALSRHNVHVADSGRPAAVLFDMDGTLVDTEPVWEVGLHELATWYGGVLSDEVRLAMVGTSAERTMELMLTHLGLTDRDPMEGADWLDTRVKELFAEGVEWRPGARELLHAVRAAGLPTALVTNTRRLLADVLLVTLGVHNFDVVVCGDEVPRTKPDPAPYLAAAELLGVDPTECVAIEDSPTGVASALAAGCALIAVPHDVEISAVDGLLVRSLLDVDVSTLRSLAAARVQGGAPY